MKVAHIVSNDFGGAGRAALRIVEAQRENGIDACLYVIDAKTTIATKILNSKVQELNYIIGRKTNSLFVKLIAKDPTFAIEFFGCDITKNSDIMSADLLHFHWVEAGVMPYRILKKISKLKKPIVWTFHDMCPFTGGCHYDSFCGKYTEQCSKCPNLKIGSFATKLQHIKENAIKNMKVIGVGCSEWIAQSARKSSIFSGKEVVTIGNTLDFNIYKPYDKDAVLKQLGISTKKKIILFGAIASDKDKRKGLHYLAEGIKGLSKKEYAIAIFGNSGNMEDIFGGYEVINFGQIYDENKLAEIYSCADVFVAPSIQENLSNAVMESLACGTPVVAFNIGGMSDLICHNKSGYLVTPFCTEELTRAIIQCADDENMGIFAAQNICKKFGNKNIAMLYAEVYKKVMETK